MSIVGFNSTALHCKLEIGRLDLLGCEKCTFLALYQLILILATTWHGFRHSKVTLKNCGLQLLAVKSRKTVFLLLLSPGPHNFDVLQVLERLLERSIQK